MLTNFIIGKIATEILLQVDIIVISEKTELESMRHVLDQPIRHLFAFHIALHLLRFQINRQPCRITDALLQRQAFHHDTKIFSDKIDCIIGMEYIHIVNFAHQLICMYRTFLEHWCDVYINSQCDKSFYVKCLPNYFCYRSCMHFCLK